MKKQLAIAVTLALLALPVNSGLVLAETTSLTTTEAADVAVSTISTDGTITEDTTTSTDATVSDESTTPTEGTVSTADEDIPPVVDENGDTVDPGTLPDSPVYWLVGLIEKLQVILTFDAEEKTALMERQALKKLAAAQEMAEQGKTEEAQKAMTEYVEKLEKAQAFLETVKDPESDTYKKLESALANTSAKNIEALSTLLDKLPPQAAERVALNIVRSMDKAIDKMDKKEKAKAEKEFRKAAKAINQENLDEETKEALEDVQEALDDADDSEDIEDIEDTDEGEQLTVTAEIKAQAQIGSDKKTSKRTANQVEVQAQNADDEDQDEDKNANQDRDYQSQLKQDMLQQQQIKDQTKINQESQTKVQQPTAQPTKQVPQNDQGSKNRSDKR